MAGYAVKYYDITPESIENQRQYISNLSACCYSEESIAEVRLAMEASVVEQELYRNYGVRQFMFRRDLDNYLSKNGDVILRDSSKYNRFIPPQVVRAIRAVEAQDGGETFILSFRKEVNDSRPKITHSLLQDKVPDKRIGTGGYFTVSKTEVRPEPRAIDPIAFGAIRSADGKLWDKLWILGAWDNNYSGLTTAETIIAAIANRGSLEELKQLE